MSRNPKIVPIRDNYKELFKEEQNDIQTAEQITKRMRQLMKM